MGISSLDDALASTIQLNRKHIKSKHLHLLLYFLNIIFVFSPLLFHHRRASHSPSCARTRIDQGERGRLPAQDSEDWAWNNGSRFEKELNASRDFFCQRRQQWRRRTRRLQRHSRPSRITGLGRSRIRSGFALYGQQKELTSWR